MGLCTKRRVYLLFLIIIIFQIVTTGVRQIFDFFGPLWSMIFTNFLNIVFAIFGFFGGFTRRKHYLISYIVWSVIWAGWNLFIICLYIPIHPLENYKSSVLSLGTGGFSWWETRAPGCIPDWASETQLIVTNCIFDPKIVEFTFAAIQVLLGLLGAILAIALAISPYSHEDEKASQSGSLDPKSRETPVFYSMSRNSGTGGSGGSDRHSQSRHHGTNSIGRNSTRGSGMRSRLSNNNDHHDRGGEPTPAQQIASGMNILDDRLRPMTPRRVKRRSARSIQSQRYGPLGPLGGPIQSAGASGVGQASGAMSDLNRPGSSGTGNRNSLRSNASRRSSNHHRNSKRKSNHHHFVSPVNRLMQQQQVDSETSHDEPARSNRIYHMRDQGHVNQSYMGPQSPPHPPPPPRPPSARSSYSNYHPARLPLGIAPASNMNPNVFNLNQNIFTNPAFDNSPETYNTSQHSNNTNNTFYEDELHFTNGPPAYPNSADGSTGNLLTNSIQHHHIVKNQQEQLQQRQHIQSHPAIANNFIPAKQNPMPNPSFFQNLPPPKSSPLGMSNYPQPSGYGHTRGPQYQQQQQLQQQQQQQQMRPLRISPAQRSPLSIGGGNNQLSYPLAHSPVSQESFPMWGVASPQVPASPGIKQYHQVPNGMPPNISRPFSRPPVNSETVI